MGPDNRAAFSFKSLAKENMGDAFHYCIIFHSDRYENCFRKLKFWTTLFDFPVYVRSIAEGIFGESQLWIINTRLQCYRGQQVAQFRFHKYWMSTMKPCVYYSFIWKQSLEWSYFLNLSLYLLAHIGYHWKWKERYKTLNFYFLKHLQLKILFHLLICFSTITSLYQGWQVFE